MRSWRWEQQSRWVVITLHCYNVLTLHCYLNTTDQTIWIQGPKSGNV